jgi:DNA-binding MarR family transcriptional regulator
MVRKKNNLTLRQAQALLSASYRTKTLGLVTVGDLITDMGVAFGTLANHLKMLKKHGFIETPDDETPINLLFSDKLTVTPCGETTAQTFLRSVKSNYQDCTPKSLFTDLRKYYEPSGIQLDLFLNKTVSFAKAFEKIVAKNPTEPVLTSIAMYTDLDSQLSVLQSRDNPKYQILSTAKLNLEIRNGRLASIAIPTALRAPSSLRIGELWRILENSWSWMGTVTTRSAKRYWQEAAQLGLMQVNGELLTSMKPTAVDTIRWLAEKTYFTFVNTIPIAPKCSLVLFKESFSLPTEDDLFNPQNSSVDLPWLSDIRSDMVYKEDYVETIKIGLKIMMEDANLLQKEGNRILPTTYIRRMTENSEIRQRFTAMLNNDDSRIAKILIAVTSKPALTVGELYQDLVAKSPATHKPSFDDVKEAISILATNNVISYANSRSVDDASTRLFSFLHLPYIISDNEHKGEINAVLRGIKPYMLQLMKELFETKDEREKIKDIFTDLLEKREIAFDDIEREHGKTLMKKLLIMGRSLEPFVRLDSEYNRLQLNQNNLILNKIFIDSLLYSILTQGDGMSAYNSTIADLVEKDKPLTDQVEAEIKSWMTTLIQQNVPK